MKHFSLDLTNEGVALTAYLLDSSAEMPNANVRPAILIFPGGAYRVCSDREAEPIALAFLAEGYHAFVLRYSLNENAAFPRPLNDAEEAIERIREHSEEWGIDPDRVAACGFSAGGHLAAALGAMGRLRPNALILGYPCILESMGGILPAPIPDVSKAVDGRTPPTFLFHTYSDTLVPVGNSLAFASALERAKVPFEMHVFQNGVHGLSLAKASTSGGSKAMADADAAKWFGLGAAWLNNVFGDFPADREGSWDVEVEQFGVDVPLGVLWKNAECKRLVLERLPVLQESPQLDDAMGVPLRMVVEFGGGLLTNEQLDALDQALRTVPVKANKERRSEQS
ncbi:alpha/beta hydrolase [Cohnella thailandensis]|uniref:Alpha/beta hydrolase n=1 Tax=Cohnella thailandensis TaxID=557557 RepID=A0A841SXR1_9BACL|nr:alpha/beta hydrolase [Cohnella thailandensis]MBB6634620.1 alpha/beta hydrolase [Cohnella thailandensis]MBP1972824.1 acetyl esterase/lipase [Cohnella thailandensis]